MLYISNFSYLDHHNNYYCSYRGVIINSSVNFSLVYEPDRNKQRNKIRRRIIEEKKLSDAICQYNSLVTSSTKALNSADELLAVETPIWPWECGMT